MRKNPIPRPDRTKDYSDHLPGEVKTYFLSEEELAELRAKPKPKKEDKANYYYTTKRQV